MCGDEVEHPVEHLRFHLYEIIHYLLVRRFLLRLQFLHGGDFLHYKYRRFYQDIREIVDQLAFRYPENGFAIIGVVLL